MGCTQSRRFSRHTVVSKSYSVQKSSNSEKLDQKGLQQTENKSCSQIEKVEEELAIKDSTLQCTGEEPDDSQLFDEEKVERKHKNRKRLSILPQSNPTETSQHLVEHRFYSNKTLSLGLGNGSKGEKDSHESLPLDWACVSRPGNDPAKLQKENQDAYLVSKTVGEDLNSFALCVFDGHGPNGAYASTFVRDSLIQRWEQWGLGQSVVLEDAEIGRILHNSCVEVNQDLILSECDLYVSGSTAIMGVFKNGHLYVANVGDSRAVLGRLCEDSEGQLEALELSSDQKPDRQDEKARILESGGRVFEWGVPRVWRKEVDLPGLAMSRSFGDIAGESIGVFAEPEITRTTIEAEDRFVIFASDGIWEFITSEEAVEIVGRYTHLEDDFASKAAEELIRLSVERWNAVEDVVDDCTCCIVRLNYSASTAGLEQSQ